MTYDKSWRLEFIEQKRMSNMIDTICPNFDLGLPELCVLNTKKGKNIHQMLLSIFFINVSLITCINTISFKKLNIFLMGLIDWLIVLVMLACSTVV